MKSKIVNVKNEFAKEIDGVKTIDDLKNLEVKYLGKKSELYQMLRSLGTIADTEERREMGGVINSVKNEISGLIDIKKEAMQKKNIEKELSAGGFDYTMPVFVKKHGSIHPITIIQRELEQIFSGMGFTIVGGPEMETEYYNFEALNIPKHHPARDMQDTFWLLNDMILRTHTSCCQVRAMEKYNAPLKVIAPGRCSRYESIDASHDTTFYQLEGLVIDENITIANLIAVMKSILSEIFKRDVTVRLRPGYFPFVEPGFELDIQCLICGGKGCKTCKHSGWIELMPCGMVHPNVLKYSKVDTEKYTGFAFGLGLTRLVMMRYGINDIRLFNSGDLRFLKQFR